MILLDADSLVYSCGFAAQKSISLLVVEDPEGNVLTSSTTNMTDWKHEHPGWTVLDREVTVEAEPEGFAVQMLRVALSGIFDKCGRGDVEMYITGKTNFREKIATIKPYKGNRDKLHKPVHYGALRDYLLSAGAVLVEGMEADDEVSIRARRGRKEKLVISIDKDLDQIPGKHYNPQREEFYEVGRHDADQWFFRQCLTGDSVDNIGGVWRLGAAGADRILASVDARDRKSIWRRVVDCYAQSKLRDGCPYGTLSPDAAALENARLVYMLHKEEEATEWWTPEAAGLLQEGGA